MDLENELSTFKSRLEEDKIVTSADHLDDEIQNHASVSTNGISYAQELENKNNLESDMNKVHKVESDQLSNSPSIRTSTVKKGHGLKKWRRIRRDIVTDSSPNIDSSKTMKRALPGSGLVNSKQPLHNMSVEVTQMSEGSVGSVNMPTKNLNHGSISDSKLGLGSIFTAGTESESSKSSTAASAPKMRQDTHARAINKMKNLNGKGILGNSPQRNQHGNARIETTTKKARGERVNKTDKENSHSSLESDSRSSNFVFMQESLSGNGKFQSGKATSYDGGTSDEEEARESENLSDDDDFAAGASSWKLKPETNENQRSTTKNDYLVKSILTLQSVQEALENELQKFVEIGKEHGFASMESDTHLSSFDESGLENNGQSASSPLESEVITLTHKVKSMEVKLEEASALLKEKESRVSELESALKKSSDTVNFEEIEKIELEGILKKKIEAETEYLAIVKTIKDLKIVANDQTALSEELKTLDGEQEKMLTKLDETEIKTATLEKQADILETYCKEVLDPEEAVTLRNKVSKVTKCLFLQLMLLALFFWVVVLELLSPKPGVVVPT